MKESSIYRLIRRIIQILFCILALIIFAPVMLIAGIAIKLSSGSPVLYKGTRAGKNRKPYTLYKFRTMHVHAEKELSGRQRKPTDQYITRVGNILRKLKIDELPQLFNVLRGEMNLVGPRPLKPELLEEILQEYPNYVKRFEVKPGITGLAQVKHGYYVKHEPRVALDLLYIEARSLWLDIKIVARTAYLILKRIYLAVIHRLVFIFKAKKGIQLTFEELPYTILCFHNLPKDSLLLASVLKSARSTIKNLEASLELAPESPELRHHFGLAYLMEGDNQRAIQELEKSVELTPSYTEAHRDLGIIAYHQGSYESAISHLTEVINHQPNDVDALYFLGNAYQAIGSQEQAQMYRCKVAELNPNVSESRFIGEEQPEIPPAPFNKGGEYPKILGKAVLADKPNGLKKHLLSLLEHEISLTPLLGGVGGGLNSQTANLYYNLGRLYFGNRLYERAASAFKQATKINPNLIDAIIGLGNSYFQQGDYQKALENFETAIQKKRDDAALQYKVGLTLAKLGSYAVAIEKFKRALAIDPNFSKAQEHLNICQYQLGWDTE